MDLSKMSENITLDEVKEALLSAGWDESYLAGQSEDQLRASYFAEFYVDECGWA
jgi:hypothetical protein